MIREMNNLFPQVAIEPKTMATTISPLHHDTLPANINIIKYLNKQDTIHMIFFIILNYK